MNNLFQLVYILFVGLALVAGAVSVAYTLPRVASHWKGAYWLALGLAVLLTATFVIGGAIAVFKIRVPQNTTLYLLEGSLALVALELILVPYIHRMEADLRDED